MPQTATLSQVYALDNLKRAWRWLLTERRAEYKNYFRRTYRAYSVAAEDNLGRLRARLQAGAYEPITVRTGWIEAFKAQLAARRR